ncbi:hypothetical protein ANCCAN_13539 [Ancylostoma caninum]|uniref:Tyrosine-protein phosphatase domain-containing protein n=1 Tax=Ancylostoma caninum TaxID=29170 RepID=A0A368GA04_ANCCA|nr:hypothetical protein ANCCAN_13539 [Ancylostoma caninum]
MLPRKDIESTWASFRPCKIKLSPDVATAAQVEAVQTEHTVDGFMGDLERIRCGNDSVLHEEFQILETWDSAREKNCTAAEKGRTRNRFVDILPNDDTRVILRGPDDYINASLIDVSFLENLSLLRPVIEMRKRVCTYLDILGWRQAAHVLGVGRHFLPKNLHTPTRDAHHPSTLL